jgi:SAM-dependent methyltransferase
LAEDIDRSWFEIQRRIERSHWWYRGRRTLLERLVPRLVDGFARPRILDLGTGCGVNAELLSRFGETVLVDRSRDALELARRVGPRCRGDALALPFREASFDLAVALDLLEHLDDDGRGFRELARVLRRSGKLLVMVPAFEILWGPQDDVSLHKRRYTRAQLVSRVRAAGLRVRRAWFFNFALCLPIFAARKLIRLLHLAVENENEVNTPLVNGLLLRIFGPESRLSLSVDFPFGVSLGLIAEKP